MLTFLDDYFHVKNLRYPLIPSRDVGHHRILQSNWWRTLYAITEKPEFTLTFGFHRIIKNIVMHHFQGKKRHINELKFCQKPKNPYFIEFFFYFSPKWGFSRKIQLYHFLTLKTLWLHVKCQKNSVCCSVCIRRSEMQLFH